MNILAGLCTLLLLALLALTAWKQAMVARFFRRALPVSNEPPATVSILQPILSGDPTLLATLGHNLRLASRYTLEFIWLIDEGDDDAARICQALTAAEHSHTVHICPLPRPPQAVNPKTFKLIQGLAQARGEIICVLDDDTMLPPGGLEACLPYLAQPGVGLAFGLPYQVNFNSLWSALVACFVNSSSLLTYIPYTVLHEPVTINGMFYAMRRSVLEGMGGWQGLEPVLADDFAVAQRVRSHGYRLAQTPLCHAISTEVRGARHYLGLVQRWFIFPRESILRHLPRHEQALVYGLALLPALVPLVAACGIALLAWWSPAAALLPAALLAVYLAYHMALAAGFNHKYLARATPGRWAWLVPLLQIVFPLQLLAALLLPQRINWRGHIMAVERGGGFRFVRRRDAKEK